MTRCLVLGGAGFLGSNLTASLENRDWEIVILDRYYPKHLDPLGPGVRWLQADFNQIEDWSPHLSGMDYVYHCLGTTIPSSEDYPFDILTNLLPTVRLLDAAVKAGVKKVVFFSSGGTVYGRPLRLPVAETHPTDPICSYGIIKLAAEKYFQLYHHLYGLDYLIVRLSNPYGRFQNYLGAQGIIAVSLGKLARGEPVHIYGDGSVVRDFIYVEDAISGTLAAFDQPGKNHLFNIGSGEGVSILELMRLQEQVTGVHDHIQYLPTRPIDVPVNVLDIRRIKRTNGWQPKTPLSEGLTCTWDWIRYELDKKED
jgi:UDP-glucose 4-epimerase